jgi:hypothetical protein
VTVINFVPSQQSAPTYQVTLDGALYVLTVKWNLFGQRYYVECTDTSGNLIFNRPLTGSDVGLDLQSLAWNSGFAEAVTTVSHGYGIGDTVALTITGVTPAAYNGAFDCLVTGPASFSYPMSVNPGPATGLGVASYDINIAGGYFQASTLIYRTANQQFEINP